MGGVVDPWLTNALDYKQIWLRKNFWKQNLPRATNTTTTFKRTLHK